MDENNTQETAADGLPPMQMLKLQKSGMSALGVSFRLREGDILAAIDGEPFLGDEETLKAAFEDYDPNEPDIAWLLTFWRDGVFFNLCFETPFRARFDFATPEEALEVAQEFKKLHFDSIETYQNYEVFRDIRLHAALHETRPDGLATIAPLLWMLNHRLYYPMIAVSIVYAITALTHIALFVLAYILTSLYVKRAQLNLLRSYHLFEDKLYWLTVAATSESEARKVCRQISPDVRFAFEQEQKEVRPNRLERKRLREQQKQA